MFISAIKPQVYNKITLQLKKNIVKHIKKKISISKYQIPLVMLDVDIMNSIDLKFIVEYKKPSGILQFFLNIT